VLEEEGEELRCLRFSGWVGSAESVLREEAVFSQEVALAGCHCRQAKRQAMQKSM
jgi:hypothetical protein